MVGVFECFAIFEYLGDPYLNSSRELGSGPPFLNGQIETTGILTFD